MGEKATKLENEILLLIGDHFPDMIAWKSKVLFARLPNRRCMRAGLPGQPDITAIVAPYGRAVLIEAKTENDTVKPRQRALHAKFREMGAIMILARNLDDVRDGLIREGVRYVE